MAKTQGVDGKVRSADLERKLNLLAAATFGTAAGREFIDYLRSITTNVASGPEITPTALMHLEGQRYLVGVIQQRIERGHRENQHAAGQRPDPE